MKQFNQEDIDKFEHITKKIRSKIPKFNLKNSLLASSLLGLSYFLYSNYQHKKRQHDRYIDPFLIKKQISSSVKFHDFLNKIKNLDFSPTSQATISYHDLLQKKLKEQASSYGKKQVKLSEDVKMKFNLYFFGLHRRDYLIVLNKKGTIVKRSYKSPMIVGSIPLWRKKSQIVKKKGKKQTIQKVIKSKTNFRFQSQCNNINAYNIWNLEKKEKLQLIRECKEKIQPLEKQFLHLLFEKHNTQ